MIPDFVMRVRLPSSGAYAACPSGDTEYEDAYNKALKEATPPGYEIIQPRRNEKWPTDSEGYTWVRLRCTNPDNALAHWMDKAKVAEERLDRIRTAIAKIEDRT